MANTLTLTTPVNIPNIRVARVARITEVDEDNARMVVEVQLTGAGGVISPPNPWRLEITNGGVDGLAAHPAPGFTTDAVIAIRLTGAGVATAFTATLTAYHAAGADKRGNVLTALQGISGTVVGGPLNGLVRPVLPPGTVT